MQVPTWIWLATVVGIIGLLAFDFFFHVRKAHIPTIREAATWTSIYVSIALLFGAGVWILGGQKMGIEYYAGYITELSLSVDNLFVFLIILASFKVPRADQQKVLMFGIVVSLFARTGFILLGAALINSFAWMFYIFGVVLLVTAVNLLKPEPEEEATPDNFVIRLAKRFMSTTDRYDGDRLFTMVDGQRLMTPMLLVMVAIGGTDVMFALDSIPAIFGLTQNTYIVFTAVAFSLLGLRQLYFLIDGLLDRLIYLKYGLAVILGFIGVKLVLHALHENNVPFLNSGQPVNVIEIDTETSLMVIVATLLLTVVWSLFSKKGKTLTLIKNTRRHAQQYLDLDYYDKPQAREHAYRTLLAEEGALSKLPPQQQALIEDQQQLLDLLDEAHRVHEEYVDKHPSAFPNGNSADGRPRLDTNAFRSPSSPPRR